MVWMNAKNISVQEDVMTLLSDYIDASRLDRARRSRTLR